MHGYEELDHTADWALRVWAPDLEGLFVQAAAGMLHLMGVKVDAPSEETREVVVHGPDDESLLVGFLGELLLANEAEQLALAPVSLAIRPGRVTAVCAIAPVIAQDKEIKAVTYHDLEIREREGFLETVIVFDV